MDIPVSMYLFMKYMCQNSTSGKISLLPKKDQEQEKKKITESQYNVILKYKEIYILDTIEINTMIHQLQQVKYTNKKNTKKRKVSIGRTLI